MPVRTSLFLLVLAFAAPAMAQSNQTLTLHVTGAGTVSVIGAGGGLCQSSSTATCPFTIPTGASIRISASAPSGQLAGLLSGGTGPAASCGLSTCNVSMTADASLNVTFSGSNGTMVTVTVSLNGDGAGSVSADNSQCQDFDAQQGSTCGTVFLQGSDVLLKAAPASASRFSGYSGGTNGAGACGSSASCEFTVSGSAAVTVTFNALTSVSVSPATASIPAGQTQAFTANGSFSNSVTEPLLPAMGTWITKTALPATRFSLAALALGGKLYAIGGIASNAPSSLMTAYDPASNTWTTLTSMPTPREALGVASAGGLIYAIGGDTSGAVPVATVERYDPNTNGWTARAPLAAGARTLLTAAAVNGIIYAMGGKSPSGGGTTVGTVEAYDPAANTWTTKTPMPTPRQGAASAVLNGLIYVIGGGTASGPASLATVEAYNPATDTWTTKAPLPSPISLGAAVATEGVIYFIGGSVALSSVYQYDAARDSWSNKTGLPFGRAELAGDAINGVVYVAGGLSSQSQGTTTTYAFTDGVRWSSSALSIASITQGGSATGVASGTATITASAGGIVCSQCGTLTVNPPPMVTANPANQRVNAGATASFSAAASGSPAPTVEWQSSTDNGATFFNIPGAVSTTYSFVTALTDNGKQFRAVFTNANGTAVTSAATLIVLRLGHKFVPTDVDGDGKADLMVWRASSGTWFWATSSSGYTATAGKQWGNQSLGDVPLTGDIDGDGLEDLIVWRASSGTWFWLTSSSGFAAAGSAQWGNQSLGDMPLVGDIDGDGRSDLIVWRSSTGTWYWLTSSSGYAYGSSGSKQWGNASAGDQPLLADLDGDGSSDLVIWRSSTGTWFWLTSSSGYSYGASQSKQWGNSSLGDQPLLGDVDGDGIADLFVWRASTGTWYWLTSSTGYSYASAGSQQWGNNAQGDKPMLGDLDGDGKVDLVIWRPPTGTWFWLTSSSGFNPSSAEAKQFGNQSLGDIPMVRSGG